MKTQMYIAEYVRSRPQGSWHWQRRGVASLVAWPALLGAAGMPDIRHHLVVESPRRQGALGAGEKSRHRIARFSRADAQEFAASMGLELMPFIGAEKGQWLTVTP